MSDRIFGITEIRRKFAKAMKKRIDQKEAEGFFGWADDALRHGMRQRLQNKVRKGEWVDVSNFAMFLWNLDGRSEK